MEHNFSVLLVLALAFVLTGIIRWQQGSWFSPSAFFMLLWTFILFFSVLGAPDFYFSAPALLFIISLLLSFYAGGLLVRGLPMPPAVPGAQEQRMGMAAALNRVFLWYLLPSSLAGFLAFILLLRFYNFPLAGLFGPELPRLSDTMTVDRYSGLSLPTPVMLCLSLAFSGSLGGGFIFVYNKGLIKKGLALVPFLPVLLFTLVYTARAPLLFQSALFLSTMITGGIVLRGNPGSMFTPRLIGWGIVCMALLFAVFMLTQMSRMDAGMNWDQATSTYLHLRAWFFGNVSAFSFWFDHGMGQKVPVWGSYSLGGIYEWLGISSRVPGLYDTYIQISQEDISNIYTLFRLLIDDLGLGLVHLFFFVGGFISAYLFIGLLQGQYLFLPLLAAVYAIQLWSFIASIFTYNTNIFAYLIFGLILFIVWISRRIMQQA